MIGLFLVTHGTLGEALIQCVCHVLDKRPPLLGQLGLSAGEDPADALPLARRMIATVDDGEGVLLLADLYGATPCNVAHKLVDGINTRLVTGVNLPMLLRTVSYRHESLDALVSRAMIGATQGVIQVAVTAPQNQARRNTHDQDHRHHQQ